MTRRVLKQAKKLQENMDNIHFDKSKIVAITSEQYRNLGRRLPKRNVAVPYFDSGISQYSRIIAKPHH